MRIGSLRYLIKQGWKNMASNRLMTFASIGVLTACLLITGIAMLFSANINNVVDYLANQNEIVCFIAEDATAEQIAAAQAEIEAMDNVLDVTLISREEAFEQMQEWMADYGNLLDGYAQIFPANYRVTVDDLNLIRETDDALQGIAIIDSTSAPTELAGIMVTLKNAVTYGGWAIVIVLALVSIVVISNTIRLTVFARRREISIMKYVGATNAFIRLPFFVEGMTVGLIAGLLSSGVICVCYYFLYNYFTESYNIWVLSLISSLYSLQDIWYWVVGSFIVAGMLLGGLGSASSIRKHLKV